MRTSVQAWITPATANREVILNVGYPAGLHLKINEQPVEIPYSKNPYSIRIVLK
jgi:hypothetical protein